MKTAGVQSSVIEVIQTGDSAKRLYLRLAKSAAKEIMLIFPTTNAFIRQEKTGVIQLRQKEKM